MDNEAQFGQRVQQLQTGEVQTTTGALPIRISIPTSGQVYRFAKTIVSDEELTLDYAFVSDGVKSMLSGLAGLAVAALLWFNRRRMLRAISSVYRTHPAGSVAAAWLVLTVIAFPWSRLLATVPAIAAVTWLVYRRLSTTPRTASPGA
jgi:hypothetical protein